MVWTRKAVRTTLAALIAVYGVVWMAQVVHIHQLDHHDRHPALKMSFVGTQDDIRKKTRKQVEVLTTTAYLEPPYTLSLDTKPLPIRNTSAARLRAIRFPKVAQSCQNLTRTFPVDEYPTLDPWLPWIHDIFVVKDDDNMRVTIVAQNKRRCWTGKDVEAQSIMKYWEPQVALQQAIPIVTKNQTTAARLAASVQEATFGATRFQCHFHSNNISLPSETTYSTFPFDYEYVHWRKMGGKKPQFLRQDKDVSAFWQSQLMIYCPIPVAYQKVLLLSQSDNDDDTDAPRFHMDLIPIRTPPRMDEYWLTPEQMGPAFSTNTKLFDLQANYGKEHVLPAIRDAGRWANLPICMVHQTTTSTKSETESQEQQQKNRLVACTWTSASYTRRGDAIRIADSVPRLMEWMHFHWMVGFDHLYIYDNTVPDAAGATPLLEALEEAFARDREHRAKYTYISWPASICNNHRPMHEHPGERSSQYAAEASCRERYGSSTDWMTFLDTDEYLVPMHKKHGTTWHSFLDEMDKEGIKILKFKSSRGKPRWDLMQDMAPDPSACWEKENIKPGERLDSCLVPKTTSTFLQIYNCDFIRPPKPERFQRAMKQLYRPDFVLSHFVHYSTVTRDVAETYAEFQCRTGGKQQFISNVHDPRWKRQSPEVFVDELTQGALIHARSVLPHETIHRTSDCVLGSKTNCNLGHVCNDSVPFVDELHKKQLFQNPDGSYCNCWKNSFVEDVLVPKLEALLGKKG